MPVQQRHALVANAERCARLCAIGNFQSVFTLEGRYTDFSSHRCLGYRYGDDAVQVIAFPGEERVVLYMQDNIKITRRPTKLSHLSRSREADSGTILNPRGNLRLDGPLTQHASFPLALRAGIGDHTPRPLACRAGAGDTEESLLIAHLAAASA